MALTQAEWLEKIRDFKPNWWFENEENQIAHEKAMAKLLSVLEQQIEDHVAESFILKANGTFLVDHGDERSVAKLPGEFDDQYRVRVQSLKNNSNCPDLKEHIDKLLMIGEAEIREDFDSDLFLDRETFLNRGDVLIENIINVFSVIVDEQKHEPFSFLDREMFLDRDEFVGTAESSQYVFDLLSQSLNENKAEGTKYRIIERLNAA